MPWEIDIYIFTGHVHVLLFAIIYTTFDVAKAKPKLVLHIVGEAKLIFESLVYKSKGVMFVNSNFGNTQS